jgi:DNA-binding response OmpR family regulator
MMAYFMGVISPDCAKVKFKPTLEVASSLLKPCEATMQSEHQPEETNCLDLKAILVVDDDRELATALQWILAEENYLVDVAFDGEEAILKVKTHQYDIVICDLKMPRLRGDEFYLRIRELRPELADHFIFITAYALETGVAKFLNNHEVKYLVKPLAVQGLIDCVKEMHR